MQIAIVSALFLCLLLAEPCSAEQAALSGQIVLPAMGVDKKRTFKRDYRRRSRRQETAGVAQSDPHKSPYRDVVISAHPRSFEASASPLPQPVTVEQFGVAFVPRVIPITVGTTLEFINQDHIYHNVFSLTPGAKFDIGRKPTGIIERRNIDKVGVVQLFCDIHPQMSAVVLSLDTPYFSQVDREGKYAIGDLPSGTYEVRVYHPDLGGLSEVVELQTDQQLVRDFLLGN